MKRKNAIQLKPENPALKLLWTGKTESKLAKLYLSYILKPNNTAYSLYKEGWFSGLFSSVGEMSNAVSRLKEKGLLDKNIKNTINYELLAKEICNTLNYSIECEKFVVYILKEYPLLLLSFFSDEFLGHKKSRGAIFNGILGTGRFNTFDYICNCFKNLVFVGYYAFQEVPRGVKDLFYPTTRKHFYEKLLNIDLPEVTAENIEDYEAYPFGNEWLEGVTINGPSPGKINKNLFEIEKQVNFQLVGWLRVSLLAYCYIRKSAKIEYDYNTSFLNRIYFQVEPFFEKVNKKYYQPIVEEKCYGTLLDKEKERIKRIKNNLNGLLILKNKFEKAENDILKYRIYKELYDAIEYYGCPSPPKETCNQTNNSNTNHS